LVQVVAEWLLFIARRTRGCRYSMARLHVSGRYPIVIGTISNQDNALERARNVVEHFDEYYRGTGKQQKQDQADKTPEDPAQNYRIDFEPPADRPQLRVGPVRPAEALFTIDLVTTAPQAARQLVDAIHAAIVQDQTPNTNG
jgi:hypothetical protein